MINQVKPNPLQQQQQQQAMTNQPMTNNMNMVRNQPVHNMAPNLNQQQYMVPNVANVGQPSTLPVTNTVMASNEEEDRYNRKIEELKCHLPRLEKMLINSS
jgi:hypothetical protein